MIIFLIILLVAFILLVIWALCVASSRASRLEEEQLNSIKKEEDL